MSSTTCSSRRLPLVSDRPPLRLRLRSLVLELLVPDDFSGQPYARLANQVGHWAAGVGPGFALGIVLPGLLASAVVGGVYLVAKELAFDARRGASVVDVCADVAFLTLGAGAGAAAAAVMPVAFVSCWVLGMASAIIWAVASV